MAATQTQRPATGHGAADDILPEEGAFRGPHLLDLSHLSTDAITDLLNAARAMAAARRAGERPDGREAAAGADILHLFCEPSTRTDTAFRQAASALGASVTAVTPDHSSITKGETLRDTVANMAAAGMDAVVIRHGTAGFPHRLARHSDLPIINAGDGWHAHPSQTLLDLYTMREAVGPIQSLAVAIVGDIRHSRVARSNIAGLTRLGARVIGCGPPTMLPADYPTAPQLSWTTDLSEALSAADVCYLLRVQKERLGPTPLVPSHGEYHRWWGVASERLTDLPGELPVMHPGPTNPGVEITQEVAKGRHSLIRRQVANGVAVRMAVLARVLSQAQRSGHLAAAAKAEVSRHA